MLRAGIVALVCALLPARAALAQPDPTGSPEQTASDPARRQVAEPPASRAPEADPVARGPWPYVTLAVAGAALAGGVAMHVKALDTKAEAESSLPRYNELANDYESQRTITYALYTVALVGGAVGAWLWFRGPPDDGGFHASAAVTPAGGMVNLGWSR